MGSEYGYLKLNAEGIKSSDEAGGAEIFQTTIEAGIELIQIESWKVVKMIFSGEVAI